MKEVVKFAAASNSSVFLLLIIINIRCKYINVEK